MANATPILTDLEGAILTEIGFRGNQTAFRVRRAFAQSPSASWRGSAEAVYPAIRRLTERGLIAASPLGGRRGGNHLEVAHAGSAALDRWLFDSRRAADVGSDPFRLRAGLLKRLPSRRQLDLIERLRAALEQETTRLTSYAAVQDEIEQAEIELAVELQKVRRKWLDRLEASLSSAG